MVQKFSMGDSKVFVWCKKISERHTFFFDVFGRGGGGREILKLFLYAKTFIKSQFIRLVNQLSKTYVVVILSKINVHKCFYSFGFE